MVVTPEKANLVVLLLHDVTGVKKKDIKAILKYGLELARIYEAEQDFNLNETPKGKTGARPKTKKSKQQGPNKKAKK